LPIRIAPASRGSRLGRLFLFAPPALALVGVVAMLAIRAASEPHLGAALADRPLAALQIALGLVIWAALFVVPAAKALLALLSTREIDVDRDTVTICDRSLLGRQVTTVPTAEYLGLAHHVRASLSGVVHEIVLVHPRRALTVPLLVADQVSERMLGEARALLSLPEVPPRMLYQRRRVGTRPLEAPSSLQPAGV
jgi:hypothetical protein